MGALEIRNAEIRCPKCLEIKRIMIMPDHPETQVQIMCKCSQTVESLFEYYDQTKKKIEFNIVCVKCNKTEMKHPRFCHECLKVYCHKCANDHLSETENIRTSINVNAAGHRITQIEKNDFFCATHQLENVVGFCQQCLMNICKSCIKEGVHEFHQVELYTSIMPDKNARDSIKQGLKKSEEKIEKNRRQYKKILKKFPKYPKLKELEKLMNYNEEVNKDILELLKYFYSLYDHSKQKNYSVIFNIIANANFNLKKYKLPNKPKEEDINIFTKFLKKNFIIKRRKKETGEILSDESSDDEVDDTIQPKCQLLKRRSSTLDENSLKNVIKEDENVEIALDTDLNPPPQFPVEPKNDPITRDHKNSCVSPKPVKVIKNVKIPDIFTQKKEEKPVVMAPIKKLNMPIIFEKKEEKPKERGQIIKTGADSSKMNENKDFLKQMFANKGMGMGMGMRGPAATGSGLSENQVVSIVHENAEEGKTEEVIIKATGIQKGKRKARKKFMTENLDVVDVNPYPEPEVKNEENEKIEEAAKENAEEATKENAEEATKENIEKAENNEQTEEVKAENEGE